MYRQDDILSELRAMSFQQLAGSLCQEGAEYPENHLEAVRSPLRILVAGKCGAGKSTLVNSILGNRKEITVSPDSNASRKIFRKTLEDGVEIEVRESIGEKLNLPEDGIIHLVLCCISIDPCARFVDRNPAILRALQDAYGTEVWNHCVIAFTFSNQAWQRVRKKCRHREKAEARYRQHISRYAAKVRAELMKMDVPCPKVRTIFDDLDQVEDEHQITDITIIPVGDDCDDVLPGIVSSTTQVDAYPAMNWRDALLREIRKKCNGELKARYYHHHNPMPLLSFTFYLLMFVYEALRFLTQS